ncbi:MAG: hypothetical protein AB7O24_22125 [Kofleriaceae bacterium]
MHGVALVIAIAVVPSAQLAASARLTAHPDTLRAPWSAEIEA